MPSWHPLLTLPSNCLFKGNFHLLDERLDALSAQCRDELKSQGFDEDCIGTTPFLHLRYDGTDCALMVSADHHPASDQSCRHGDFKAAFVERSACDPFCFSIL